MPLAAVVVVRTPSSLMAVPGLTLPEMSVPLATFDISTAFDEFSTLTRNVVVAGTMHTPLVEHRLVKQLGADAAELIAARHAAVPIGRMGDAWDVANAVVFLASDEARYITATQLVVDGGLTAARPA